VGGRTTRGKRAADDRTTQQEGGAHDVVGGGGDDGNCGGDSGGGGWSSEVGGAPTSMPGTATVERPPIGLGGGQRRGDRCRGDDHHRDTTLTTPIAERDRTMHHWPSRRKKIRRMGNRKHSFFPQDFFDRYST